MTKMMEFFERVSHEPVYQTKVYIYKSVVDGKKVKVYRIFRYALTRNSDLIDMQKYPQFWDFCFQRNVDFGDSKLL